MMNRAQGQARQASMWNSPPRAARIGYSAGHERCLISTGCRTATGHLTRVFGQRADLWPHHGIDGALGAARAGARGRTRVSHRCRADRLLHQPGGCGPIGDAHLLRQHDTPLRRLPRQSARSRRGRAGHGADRCAVALVHCGGGAGGGAGLWPDRPVVHASADALCAARTAQFHFLAATNRRAHRRHGGCVGGAGHCPRLRLALGSVR